MLKKGDLELIVKPSWAVRLLMMPDCGARIKVFDKRNLARLSLACA